MTARPASAPALPTLKNAVRAKPAAASNPEARNIRLWSYGSPPTAPPPVILGRLAKESADPGSEAIDAPRLCAYLGLQATLRGVAEAIAPIINASTTPKTDPPLDVPVIGRALMAYLGAQPGPETIEWRVGTRVILPIELGDQGPLVDRPIVDRAAMVRWAKDLGSPDAQVNTVLDNPATELALPDRTKIEDAARRKIDATGDGAVLGVDLCARLLANPYAVLFEGIELIRQFRRDHAGAELSFVLSLVSSLSDHQARVIGWCSAGNALFRRFWDTLVRKGDAASDEAIVAAARARLALALGLAPKPDAGAWYGPAERGPYVKPDEPVLTPAQEVRKTTGQPTYFAMVFGRKVPVGTIASYGGDSNSGAATMLPVRTGAAAAGTGTKRPGVKFTGPAHPGGIAPHVIADAYPDFLGTDPSPTLRACWDVMRQIAPNEGNIDASRQADRGLISPGMQQWTIENDDELTVLLYRFRQLAPDHFDLFFGMRGFGLEMWTKPKIPEPSKPEDLTPPKQEAIDTANPHFRPKTPRTPGEPETWRSPYAPPPYSRWGDGETGGPPDEGIPSYVKLHWLRWSSRGEPAETPQPIAVGWPARYELVGGTRNGSVVRFGPYWDGVFRLAALASGDFGIAQLQIAVFRVQRLLDDVKSFSMTSDGKTYTLPQLMSSQFAAAGVIDAHVNQPGKVVEDVRAAFDRTQKVQPHRLGVSAAEDDAWLMRLAVNYLGMRRVVREGKGNRDDLLLKLHDNGLDPHQGTFGGWPAS